MFASDKYISPMAVGVDIGCGMIAVPVEGLHRRSEKMNVETMRRLQQAIKSLVPTGLLCYLFFL